MCASRSSFMSGLSASARELLACLSCCSSSPRAPQPSGCRFASTRPRTALRTRTSGASCAIRAASCGSAPIDGLSRFDGAEFVTYRTGDGLPDPWVTDLLTTRDGTYWVATNGGVARFDALTRHFPRDGQRQAEQRASVFQQRGLRGVANTTSGSRPAGGSRRSRVGGRSRWAVHAR